MSIAFYQGFAQVLPFCHYSRDTEQGRGYAKGRFGFVEKDLSDVRMMTGIRNAEIVGQDLH